MTDKLFYRLQENATAILLAAAGICFAVGLLARRANAEWNRQLTLGGQR